MDGFYKVIVLIAIITYIILMTIVVVLMTRTKGQAFPPQESMCPDYWMTGSGTHCIIPNQGSQNTGRLYTKGTLVIPPHTPGVSGNVIDFGDGGWTALNGSKTALCNKQSWANANGIVWGGVTNSNTC